MQNLSLFSYFFKLCCVHDIWASNSQQQHQDMDYIRISNTLLIPMGKIHKLEINKVFLILSQNVVTKLHHCLCFFPLLLVSY